MNYRYGLKAVLVCGALTTAGAAEFFVGKQGSDANSGSDKAQAFLTIRRGAAALRAGDTLTIGPGEYSESVQLVDFGASNRDTIVRAEMPGTVLLRGNRDLDRPFQPVTGRRFVSGTPVTGPVLSVQEVDTLTLLAPAADRDALDFGPGRYFHDASNGVLFVSSSDFQPPTGHRYAVGTLRDHGFLVQRCQRVVIEGLAAAGFLSATNAALLVPSSGFLLRNTQRCVVRRCTAYLNGSGITLNGDPDGRGNLVEDCRAYGNNLDGIVIYNPAGDTIRDCQSFLNKTYGARFYGGRRGQDLCLMSGIVAWGNPGGDFWMKGSGLSGNDPLARAERCVGLMNVHMYNVSHCITGGGPGHGASADSIALPAWQGAFEAFSEREFADPLNQDFRLQATASSRQPGAGYAYKGPYPFESNVYFVAAGGSDGRDGLSVSNAWRTLGHAFRRLRPGDTLYLAAGRYTSDVAVPVKGVRIRGRGMDRVVIDGPFPVGRCSGTSFERLIFDGTLRLEQSDNLTFDNCTFAGGPAVTVEDVRGLRVTHSVLAVPLDLRRCSRVFLSGIAYAASPAVQTDTLDALVYSDYNSYVSSSGCMKVGWLKTLSLPELRPAHDEHSVVAGPGAAVQLQGRGPLGTAMGRYREWVPRVLQAVGPFVHRPGDTTANIEWWTTLPSEMELRWGDTPACSNAVSIVQSAYYTYSLTGLIPGRTYYARLKPARINADADPARRFRLSDKSETSLVFTTTTARAAARVFYIAPDGRNENDGLSRGTAWRTVQHAADQVQPGDTVLLAGGVYAGTVYFRTTGEKGRPITFKAIPGEKAVIDGQGETLKVGLVLFGKHYYRFDGLYVQGFAGIEDNMAGAENGGLLVKQGSNLQVTRCYFGGGWGPGLVVSHCPAVSIHNCLFTSSMSSCTIGRCPDLEIEHCVFMSPLISHLSVGNAAGEPSRVANNIFGDNTRGKAQVCFMMLSPTTVESNNCFYVRWPENERGVINNMTLPEYRARHGTDSFAANPQMPGSPGWIQGWGPGVGDFDAMFAGNPVVVKRGIGLQPEAFQDFPFKGTNRIYDARWADEFMARTNAAWALALAGRDAAALAAYTNLAASVPMNDRLKTDVLGQASLCANRLQDYNQALALARQMPVKSLSIRRQMALLLGQRKYSEVLAAFTDKAMGGVSFHLSLRYPELEDVMGDLFYYRSIAYAQTTNRVAAEADLRVMNEKRTTLAYSSGEAIHEVAWLRLGDFYRTQLKDDTRALAAYSNILTRTMVSPYRMNIISKPAFTGGSATLVAATRATCEILRQRGQADEAKGWELSLIKAQAFAAASLLQEAETVAKFGEFLALSSAFTAELAGYEKRLASYDDEYRKKVVAGVAGLTSGLTDEARGILAKAAGAADPTKRPTAVRSLICFAPTKQVGELLEAVEKEAREKAIRAQLEPTMKRLRGQAEARQWQALTNDFKATAFAAWQNPELAGEALHLRGRAYAALKQGAQAEADLKAAVQRLPGNQLAWSELAENYRGNLADSNKALETYLHLHELTGVNYGYLSIDVALKAAEILKEKGRSDEALRLLRQYDPAKAAGSWHDKLVNAVKALGG